MSQVDLVVYFSLLYQFILFFVLFYFILSVWVLPIILYIFKSRVYLVRSLINSILDKYINIFLLTKKNYMYLVKVKGLLVNFLVTFFK